MQFPQWVTKTRGKQALASARLRYIMCYLCLQVTSKVSFREFHAITGICTHTSVWQYIKRGAFPAGLAQKFEDYFGAEVITADALMNPLSIDALK